MLVVDRMALLLSSHHLFPSSIAFSSNRIPVFSSMKTISGSIARKRMLMKENGYDNNRVCRNNRSGFSSLAIATDSADSATTSVSREEEEEEGRVSNEEKLVLPTNESSERLLRIRHTCAHVMAMAVQKLYPDAKVTIGPWIETGFYYDFDMEPLTDKDLKRIKKEMNLFLYHL